MYTKSAWQKQTYTHMTHLRGHFPPYSDLEPLYVLIYVNKLPIPTANNKYFYNKWILWWDSQPISHIILPHTLVNWLTSIPQPPHLLLLVASQTCLLRIAKYPTKSNWFNSIEAPIEHLVLLLQSIISYYKINLRGIDIWHEVTVITTNAYYIHLRSHIFICFLPK